MHSFRTGLRRFCSRRFRPPRPGFAGLMPERFLLRCTRFRGFTPTRSALPSDAAFYASSSASAALIMIAHSIRFFCISQPISYAPVIEPS